MINRLYSLLVAGVSNILPENPNYRLHTIIPVPTQSVETSSDPYRRAMWANYMIALSRLSDLYGYLESRDRSNTYDVLNPQVSCKDILDNCYVLSRSKLWPNITGNLEIFESSVSGSVNGSDILTTIDDNGMINILDTKIIAIDTTKPVNFTIVSPAVDLPIPSENVVRSLSKSIPIDVRDNIDYSSVYDRVCAFCIGLLDINSKTGAR